MNILIDMNLSPQWVSVLNAHGHHAIHWSTIGDPKAPDQEIMNWSVANDFVIFTHDLDFGTLLAFSKLDKPSVIQIRTQEVLPQYIASVILVALQQYEEILLQGALITIDETRSRSRILPLNNKK